MHFGRCLAGRPCHYKNIMDIGWYYHRLRSMCLGEIVYRFRRLFWQISARILRSRRQRYYKENTSGTTKIVDMMKQINFYGLPDVKPDDIPEPWLVNTISAADELLEHRYSCFSREDIYLGQEVNWNHELNRDIDTPLEFAPWMDYRDTKLYGHYKYFWELGRFQHLITLSKAYYLTGEEKYALEVTGQIKGFVRQCPYLLGVHWTMPMEAAIRLISIAWIVSFMKSHLKKDAETCSLIEEIVTSHIEYVAKNFSAYSSANNHLIAEATGVYIAGLCFESLGGMAKYKQKAYEILCREIPLQFYSDGVNREQTSYYHISCYNCFLLAALLGRDNGMNFPIQYWNILEKAAVFISAIANDDNSIFSIGDTDDGKTVVLSETEFSQVHSLHVTSAVLFRRGDFKAKAKNFDEMSLWLLGNKGKEIFDALNSDSKAASFEKFEDGGYFVFKNNSSANLKVVFDCGPLGLGSIAGHGHADALSFLLYAYGRQFFVDPGTYIYEADNPYRNYFRSTAAHNTVTVDNMDQSEMRGPFLWDCKASSFVSELVDTEECSRLTGWHDGYQRLEDPVIHRRTIELDRKKDIINIEDHIEAETTHEICQYFHLAPECEVTQVKPNHWYISNGGKTIELVVDDRFESCVVKGRESPICGWVSRSYDDKVPSNTLVARSLSQGSQCFSTKIVL